MVTSVEDTETARSELFGWNNKQECSRDVSATSGDEAAGVPVVDEDAGEDEPRIIKCSDHVGRDASRRRHRPNS